MLLLVQKLLHIWKSSGVLNPKMGIARCVSRTSLNNGFSVVFFNILPGQGVSAEYFLSDLLLVILQNENHQ